MNRQKRKRGRPTTNGEKKPWRLGRALRIVHIYSRFRTKGQKHTSAVKATVRVVLRKYPEMHISDSVVKRVLAEFQPRLSPTAFLVDYAIVKGPEAAAVRRKLSFSPSEIQNANGEAVQGADAGNRPLKRFTISVGPRPNYPRHNAKPQGPSSDSPPPTPDT